MEKLARFSVSIPTPLLEDFDRWIEQRGLPNRSDALRQLIRQFIGQSQWEEGEGMVWGSVTLYYDHHSHDAAHEITHLQHDHGDIIVCTTHVHVDHDNCLEVIILNGEVAMIQSFIQDVSRLKCIKNAVPVVAGTRL